MSVTPREIGTLIVVVLRANHLPNKRHIGKQDPYCSLTLNGEKRRTKADKRGGQHPEWDEEIRFTIFEDLEDLLARTAKGDGTPPPPPPKDGKKPLKIKGGKRMKVACYADDPREPALIGDCDVDLTEVLTKGETDDWFTLSNKDKFAGKVYLELTFWSNEPPPEKRTKSKVSKGNKQYAGPGSFVPAGEGTAKPHSRQPSDVLPSSMRAASLNANLYVAPYEKNTSQSVDNLAQDLSGFGISSEPRRRESFPPVPNAYPQATPYVGGQSTFNGYPPHGFDQGVQTLYESPQAPNSQSSIHFPPSGSYPPYQPPPYDTVVAASYNAPPARGPRHSIATSSGFVPLPQPSGFLPLSSHASEPSGFAPPVSHTPVPYSQFHSPTTSYGSSASHTPAPSAGSYIQQSFHSQQSIPTSNSYPYTSYAVPASISAPPQQYMTSPSPQSSYPPHSASSQHYASSPSQELGHPPTPPQTIPFSNGLSSRPLPQQPQIAYSQPIIHQPVHSHSLPEPPAHPSAPFDPTQVNGGYSPNSAYSAGPLPPPPLQYALPPVEIPLAGSPSQLSAPPSQTSNPNGTTTSRNRRTSLPVPPVSYQQPVFQQQPPPPPPPSLEYYNSTNPLPPPPASLDGSVASHGSMYNKGLPRPPAPVNEHGQWTQAANVYSTQGC
ncbi:hypothetical protein CPB83DRAFT_879304 [Crepidotus variabilis]|uniref:C2 domain-containing protein n=1 Tax=Crepidotus variabilis TaxID=179855 RepID=A0A9P6JWI4_9AGAR|nr:hypothetical protein CPB83DRAFT_879304 [Crepidotus variabilis]